MPLTNKQKKYITENRKKSVKYIADKLNLTVEDVNNFIGTIPKKTYPMWFYLIPITIPVIFLLLLEGILKVADYGYNLDQWTEVTNTHYMLNRDVAFRYFYNLNNVPISSGNVFEIEKSDKSFRVFVLGGSSAAGFPFTPSGSFAKYIKKRLTLIYPKSNIEVVNLAFAAINSYTILDLLPGVLEQKPDLILVYAGHNEYYGALGAGSMESLGNNRGLVNFVLSLNKFKTIQLLRDTIKWIYRLFSSNEKPSGTLMSRMAKDQSIAMGSDVYNAGIEQFEGNLRDILIMVNDAEVPIIISDLTSNIKDQKPFISLKESERSADLVYNEALNQYNDSNYISAKAKFIEAKDLDALRFRAPSDINNVIGKLAVENNIPLISSETAFAEMIEDGIVGDELMTDHLHPKIIGYQIIGKLFFEKMLEMKYLPSTSPAGLSLREQDSLTRADYDFTYLDSRIAEYRLILLKSDWPYSEKPKSDNEVLSELNMRTYTDSLAYKVVNDNMNWEKAHRDLATYYIRRGEVEAFINEIEVLMFQFPLITEYYKLVSRELLKIKEYVKSYPYLEEYYNRGKDGFSSKWLGIIDLSENKVKSAIKYLEESLIFNAGDAQVLFNLAGAYSLDEQYRKGLDTINRCLRINPKFNEARGLQSQLQNILMNQNR